MLSRFLVLWQCCMVLSLFFSFAFLISIFNIALHLIFEVAFVLSLTSPSWSTCKKFSLCGCTNFQNAFFICILLPQIFLFFLIYVFAKLLCPSFLFYLCCIWAALSRPPICFAVVWMNSSGFSVTLGSRGVEELNCSCVQPLLGTLLGSSGILLNSPCAKLCPSIVVYFDHTKNIVGLGLFRLIILVSWVLRLLQRK